MNNDFDFEWKICDFCGIDHVNEQKECCEKGMKAKINSLKGEVVNLESELGGVKKTLKEANGVISKFSDPNNPYWVDRVTEYEVKEGDKIRKEKVYIMKSIIQLSKLPAEYIEKNKVK